MKNLKEFLVFCLSTALSLSLLAACGKPQIPMAGAETPAEPSSAASEGSLRVMASFYPMYDFAQKIGGDKVTVTNMVPAGTEPHDWEPSPSDIVALEQADVFVYSGAGMEHWVEDVLASLDNQSLVTVEASYGIALLEGHHHHHEGVDHQHTEQQSRRNGKHIGHAVELFGEDAVQKALNGVAHRLEQIGDDGTIDEGHQDAGHLGDRVAEPVEAVDEEEEQDA